MSKKYSIGLSLINCSKKEWFKILKMFKDKISYIYYSPNDYRFFSRRCSKEEFHNVKDQEQYEILEKARELGIKTELALNTSKKMNKKDIEEVLLKEKEKHTPDFVVTYNKYISIVSNIFTTSKFTLSYNEGIMSETDLYFIDKRFSTIILGNRWLRDRNVFKKANMLGFKTELLVNNGCVDNCNYCFSEKTKEQSCKAFFDLKLKNNTINDMLAICSVSRREIEENFEKWGLISNYKISTRPFTYNRILTILGYFLGEDKEATTKELFLEQLVCLKHFSKHVKEINIAEVKELKSKIWENIKEEI